MAYRKPPFIFWWVKADCEREFGLMRTSTLESAIEEWGIITAPIDPTVELDEEYRGVCIYHEPTGTIYTWPDHPTSVKDPERVAKKMLKNNGFKVDEKKIFAVRPKQRSDQPLPEVVRIEMS